MFVMYFVYYDYRIIEFMDWELGKCFVRGMKVYIGKEVGGFLYILDVLFFKYFGSNGVGWNRNEFCWNI